MSPAAMVPQTGLKGAGILIPVVGPSGAGKDTLISAARNVYGGSRGVVFPTRVVTRDPDPLNEDHVAIGITRFEELEAGGAFATSWRAHGHGYGIPATITDDLGSGRVVVVNVSRSVVAALRRRFARVHVAYVTAPGEVLATRLRARGRETETEIVRRVARARELPIPDPPVTLIDNSGALADAVDTFLAMLADYAPTDETSRV